MQLVCLHPFEHCAGDHRPQFAYLAPLQELDEAARRRMPKQLYIPLPCAEARRLMILRQLGPGASVAAQLNDEDLDKVVAKTQVCYACVRACACVCVRVCVCVLRGGGYAQVARVSLGVLRVGR